MFPTIKQCFFTLLTSGLLFLPCIEIHFAHAANARPAQHNKLPYSSSLSALAALVAGFFEHPDFTPLITSIKKIDNHVVRVTFSELYSTKQNDNSPRTKNLVTLIYFNAKAQEDLVFTLNTKAWATLVKQAVAVQQPLRAKALTLLQDPASKWHKEPERSSIIRTMEPWEIMITVQQDAMFQFSGKDFPGSCSTFSLLWKQSTLERINVNTVQPAQLLEAVDTIYIKECGKELVAEYCREKTPENISFCRKVK